jgi:hypothetical protein
MMQNIWRDLIYAARLLRQAPGFTFLVALALTIGIGANCATFSLVDAVLLRPLPFAHPEGLVRLWEKTPDHDQNSVAPLNFLDWSEQNQVFSAMAATSGGSKTLVTATGAERIPGQTVTARFFKLFGVAPLAGRTFTEDDVTQNPKAIVLSEGLWKGRFAGDPNLIGSTLNFEGELYRVIGIMPASSKSGIMLICGPCSRSSTARIGEKRITYASSRGSKMGFHFSRRKREWR